MRGGTLKRQALVFESKDFRSRGDNGGVFEMNQDPVSSEQNNCGEHQRQKARKYMRHSFPSRGSHNGTRSYCGDLTPRGLLFHQPLRCDVAVLSQKRRVSGRHAHPMCSGCLRLLLSSAEISFPDHTSSTYTLSSDRRQMRT